MVSTMSKYEAQFKFELREWEVHKKMKIFVKNVVSTFENKLTDYIKQINNVIQTSGTSFNSIITEIEIETDITKISTDDKTSLSGIFYDVLLKILCDYNVQYQRNELSSIINLLSLFNTEPERVRTVLIESSYKIFCSFHYQLVHVISSTLYEEFILKFAEVVVERVFKYYRVNQDLVFSIDTVTNGLIFEAFQNTESAEKQVNAAKLFYDIGLTCAIEYYGGIESDIAKSRYGLLFSHVNFHDYCKGSHEYVFTTSENITEKLQEILNEINKQDEDWYEEEEEVTVKDGNIIQDLFYLDEYIKQNIEGISLFIRHNCIEIEEHVNSLIMQYNQHVVIMNDVPDFMENPNFQFDSNQDDKQVFWLGIPNRSHLFTGRHKQLSDIHEKLNQKSIVVISGLNGVGKSELVFEYVHNYYNKNQFVICLDMSSDSTAIQEFKNLHNKLGLEDEDDIELIVEEVYETIGENSFFIFDNAQSYKAIEQFLPLTIMNKPTILITSPNVSKKEWFSRRFLIETLLLDCFTDTEAIQFFKTALKINGNKDICDTDLEGPIYCEKQKRYRTLSFYNFRLPKFMRLPSFTKNSNTLEIRALSGNAVALPIATGCRASVEDNVKDNDIGILVRKLQNFPLALHQAASYIKLLYKNISENNLNNCISEYLNIFDDNLEMLLNYKINNLTVFEIIENIIRKIETEHNYGQQAADVLKVISYCMSDDIPLNVFLNEFAESCVDKMLDIINILRNYDLIRINNGMINIHEFVQVIVKSYVKNANQEIYYIQKAIDLFLTNWSKQDAETYLCHVMSIWRCSHNYNASMKNYVMDRYEEFFTNYFYIFVDDEE